MDVSEPFLREYWSLENLLQNSLDKPEVSQYCVWLRGINIFAGKITTKYIFASLDIWDVLIKERRSVRYIKASEARLLSTIMLVQERQQQQKILRIHHVFTYDRKNKLVGQEFQLGMRFVLTLVKILTPQLRFSQFT